MTAAGALIPLYTCMYNSTRQTFSDEMFVINIISSSNKVNNSHKSVFTQSETGSCQIYQGGQRPRLSIHRLLRRSSKT